MPELRHRLVNEAEAVRPPLRELSAVRVHRDLSVQGISSQSGVEAGSEVVAAEVVAARSDDKAMAEVMNRLSIEPGVLSVRWEKGAADVAA